MSEQRGMRTPTLVGLLVVAGVGIGALLSSILPDLPFGTGKGWNGIGNPPATTTPGEEKSASKKVETPPKEEPEPEAAVEEPEIEYPAVVYVLINGRDYLLRKGPEDRASQKPASLEAVIQAVKQATGDESGVRVRIYETTTARTSTLQALLDGLEEAKIPRSEIRHKDEPVVEAPIIR